MASTAARLDHSTQLAECGGAVVGRADQTYASFRLELVEQIELLTPRHEIVNLVEIDPSPEECQRSVGLDASFARRRGPDLRGDERPVAPAFERKAEHALGLPVHRRRVEERGSRIHGRVDDRSRMPIGGAAPDVERLPRAHADGRHRHTGGAERA